MLYGFVNDDSDKYSAFIFREITRYKTMMWILFGNFHFTVNTLDNERELCD